MKRYNVLPHEALETMLGAYVLHEESAAIITEKDKEIARLTAGWHEANRAELEKSMQLRASNEALVAAEARIEHLTKYINACMVAPSGMPCTSSPTDNLTALEAHDKEVRGKALREAAEWANNNPNIDSCDVASELRKMAEEIRNG